MPSEPNNLHHLFGESPENPIDVTAVLRRSRARRLPRVLGVGAFGILAIGGIAIGGFQGLSQIGGGAVGAADSSAGSAPEAEAQGTTLYDLDSTAEGDIKRAPAEKINLCTGTLAEVAPSQTGLVLSVAFPSTAQVGAGSVEGTVTMTNTGSTTLTGYTTASPAVTLSQAGIVYWHSNGATIDLAREFVLEPGDSVEYAASFVPAVCSVEDDAAQQFRADLPPAPAGDYAVSAAIDFMGDQDAQLVTGPAQSITLK